MRRSWVVLAALVALTPACSDEPQRPEPTAGRAERIVGGGTRGYPSEDDSAAATSVGATDLVAMAVTPEGTIYVLHGNGTIYRADVDGRLTTVGPERLVGAVGSDGGMALTAEGDLGIVGDLGTDLIVVSVADATAEHLPLDGLPDDGRAVALAYGPGDVAYIADAGSGSVYERSTDGALHELARFEPPGCGPQLAAEPSGVSVDDGGAVLVADPGCDVLYRIDDGDAEFVAGVRDFDTNERLGPDCPDGRDTGFFPTAVTAARGRLLVAIEACTTVWSVTEDASRFGALVNPDAFDGEVQMQSPVRAIGTDDHGHIYVLDARGVVMFTE